jgi:hypothetical protein
MGLDGADVRRRQRDSSPLVLPRPQDRAGIFTLGRKADGRLASSGDGLSASSRHPRHRVAHMWPSMRVMKQALAAAEIPAEASIGGAAAIAAVGGGLESRPETGGGSAGLG